MSSGGKHLRNLGVVSGATLVSRVFGLVRDMQITAVFGVGALASAFVTAFMLPNLFRRLLGEGALTAALVPTVQEELHRGQRPAAFALLSQIASWLGAVTGCLALLAMGAMATARLWLPPAAGHWVEADTMERWLAGASLAVWLFPYLVMVCFAAACSAVLQVLGRFLVPALGPIWLNSAMIGLLWLGARLTYDADRRMRWLCVGVLLGGFFQMMVPVVALVREGWRPVPDMRLSPPVRRVLFLMGPTVFSSAIYLVNMAMLRIIGLSLNDQAAALLNLATRLMELPIGLFAVSVSTVVFPLIAQKAAAGDWDGFSVAYRRGLRLVLMVNTPAAAGLAMLAQPAIRVLFQRGEFHGADTLAMTPVLVAMAVALPVLSFVNLALRAFYAHKDTRTPLYAALVSFGVNVVLSFLLMRWWSTTGLAVASTLSALVQAIYLQRALTRRREALGLRPLAADCLRILAAAVVMIGAVLAVRGGVDRMGVGVFMRDVASLALCIPVGVGTYFGALYLLGFDMSDATVALLAKLRRRGSSTATSAAGQGPGGDPSSS